MTFEGTYGGYSETRRFVKQAEASKGAEALKFAKGECDHVLQSFHGIPTKTRNQDRDNDDAVTVVVPPAFHAKKTEYERSMGGQVIDLSNCGLLNQSYTRIVKSLRDQNLDSVERFSTDLLNPINVQHSYKMAWQEQLAQLVEQRKVDGFKSNEAVPHYTVGVINEAFDGVYSKFMNLKVKVRDQANAVMESEPSTRPLRQSSLIQTWNQSLTLKRMRSNLDTLSDEMTDLLKVSRYWEHRLSNAHGSECPQAKTYQRTIKHGVQTYNRIIDEMLEKEKQLGESRFGSLLRTKSQLDEAKAEELKTCLYNSVGVDQDGVLQANATPLTDEKARRLMIDKGIGDGTRKYEIRFTSLKRLQTDSLKEFMSGAIDKAFKLGRSTSRGIDP